MAAITNQCTNVRDDDKVRIPVVFRLLYQHGFFDYFVIVVIIIFVVIDFFFVRVIVNQKTIDLIFSVTYRGTVPQSAVVSTLTPMSGFCLSNFFNLRIVTGKEIPPNVHFFVIVL